MHSSIRNIGSHLLPAFVLWAVCCGLAFAQEPQIQQPTRALDLEALIPSQLSAPSRFTSIRSTSAGIFVWVETGTSPRAGTRAITVYQFGPTGLLLRSTPLPSGSTLTQTGDFGVDGAGNVYALRITQRIPGEPDDISLIAVDSRGEVVDTYELARMPATFAVGDHNRISVLSSEGVVVAPDAPATPVARGSAPSTFSAGGPPRWWPLLEQTELGLFLVDGVDGTIESISGLQPGGKALIASARLRTVVDHIHDVHSSASKGPSFSVQPALRGSSSDEKGNLYFTVMGTKPSDGLLLVRLDVEGRVQPELRLGVPIDKNRPDAFGRPRSGGDGALMFPQDFTVRQGRVFVLGVHGLLAVYEI